MAKRDYYEILGVGRDATQEEVKQAYRRLAKQFHPDMNPENRKEAEERFKELSEAYEVLADPEKRQLYDRYGHEGVSSRFGPGGFAWRDFTHLDDLQEIFGDLFEGLFGGGLFGDLFGRREHRRARGGDIRIKVRLSLEEVASGVEKDLPLTRYERCPECGGGGGKGVLTCPGCGGEGEVSRISQGIFGFRSWIRTACPRCGGSGQVYRETCPRCRGEGRERRERRVKVRIPPGVATGHYLTLRGEGHYGPGGSGDIIIEIEEKPHHLFVRQGDEVLVELKVPVWLAVLGGEVEVPGLNGAHLLKIPAGVQPGELLRIRGGGLPRFNDRGRGDQLVAIKVVVPKRISGDERALYKELSRLSGLRPEPGRPE